ncbi:MAG: hypothetical protein JXO72_14010, partial [Vicinamibacteria bacterium]|nr:hypothetical protein [Vicinamibacteria bacterium]
AGFGLTATGILMNWDCIAPTWLSFAYTLHDVLAVLVLCGVTAHFYLAVIVNPGALRGIIDGTVGASWIREHHSRWEAKAAGAGISHDVE